jgi:hypothetical protein
LIAWRRSAWRRCAVSPEIESGISSWDIDPASAGEPGCRSTRRRIVGESRTRCGDLDLVDPGPSAAAAPPSSSAVMSSAGVSPAIVLVDEKP